MNKKVILTVAVLVVTVMCVALLAACAPASDPDKAIAALEKNEYVAAKDATIIPTALKLLGVKDIDCVVSGSAVVEDKDGNKSAETVTIVYFSSSDAATAAWDKVKSYAEDKKEDKEDSNWVCKKSGKMIYYGTEAGVKAAR